MTHKPLPPRCEFGVQSTRREARRPPSASFINSNYPGCPAALTAKPRVEDVPQTVAEQVDREDRGHDRQSRKERHPPRARQKLAALREHVAPFRRGRTNA